MSRRKSPPKYTTLKAFMEAHAKGEIPRGSRLRYVTCTADVVIETRRYRVLYRVESAEEFLMAFASACGMEGMIA